MNSLFRGVFPVVFNYVTFFAKKIEKEKFWKSLQNKEMVT
jgi:hypothetical protein